MDSFISKMRTALAVFAIVVISGCGGGDNANAPASPPPIIALPPEAVIAIEGVLPGIPPGELIQLKAIRTTSAGVKTDTTLSVSWTSSDARVATIDSKGQLTTLAAGSVTISAIEPGASGKVEVTVDIAPKLLQIGGAMQGRAPALRFNIGSVFAGTDAAAVDGIGIKARFDRPRLAATDGTFLYVVDQYKTIRKIEIATGAVLPAFQHTGPTSSYSGFAGPPTICGLAYRAGFLYVSDCGQGIIVRINLSDGVTSLFAGTAGRTGSVDGTASAARFSQPSYLSIDADHLYVVDGLVVRKVSLSSGLVTTLLDPTRARSRYPASELSICTEEGSASIWVADGSVIRRIDKTTGIDSIYAGTVNDDYQSRNGALQNASFTQITGMSCNGPNLYIMEFYNDYSAGGSPNGVSLRRINTTTSLVETIAGGSFRTGNVDGDSATARFGVSDGIVNINATKLLVTDTVNGTIRVVDISGNLLVTTLAGLARNADGSGTSARFTTPGSITTDGINLYVSDTAAYVIRQISISSGKVTTLAGFADKSGLTDGPSDVARFIEPTVIATDGVFVYVYDANFNNRLIRKINIRSGLVTTLAGRRRDASNDPYRYSDIQQVSGMTELGGYLYVSQGPSILKISTITGDEALITPDLSSWDPALVAKFYGFTEHWARGLTSDGTSLFFVNDNSINRVNTVTGAVSGFVAFDRPTNRADSLGSISSDGKNIYVVKRGGDILKIDISSKVITELFRGTATVPPNFYNSDLGITTDGYSLFTTNDVGGLVLRYR